MGFCRPPAGGPAKDGVAPGNPPGIFNPRFSAREGPLPGKAGADWKLWGTGLCMPGGSLKLAGIPPTEGGPPGDCGMDCGTAAAEPAPGVVGS